eukprot:CAMPEP_0172534334 /NCGR_PEP_ID=MMETSP1067-20121228/6732_1 /TAXON_ID=265564 ORGANISM="Thalassiosira punctigera, Strain Tpunct2005C2" /NCGR_SAMPLE_ID=MMETSP1067 /ASSEMBLY_ACC=CAM_ASM_000444 /LENGTH=323 /DNA_ID=CAMNT_0013319111 /DNA_START=69 /DNA_END=1037 /DNA_ORIENTATION=-
MARGGWISRKRKRRAENDAGGQSAASVARPPSLTINDTDAPTSSSLTTATGAIIPASLMPHLGWTKLSACHARPRVKRRRRDDDWDQEEGVRKVAGRAVFFIHDPRPGGETAERDESKIWFQGRFFPSAGAGSVRRNNSPTSVSSERVAPPSGGSAANTSWGLLAVQNEIVDECLTCSEGGYRELDLTFIRKKTNAWSRKEKKVRWAAHDVVWNGGNMMALSTDPYCSPYSPLSNEGPGVKFEPQKLMEGERAMEVAEKYFPSMAKRLRIHDVTNGGGESEATSLEAMVIIGDLEVVAPASFVNVRRVIASHLDGSSDVDGLW